MNVTGPVRCGTIAAARVAIGPPPRAEVCPGGGKTPCTREGAGGSTSLREDRRCAAPGPHAPIRPITPHSTPIAAATETARAPEGTSPCPDARPRLSRAATVRHMAKEERFNADAERCTLMHADGPGASTVLHGRHRTTEPGEPRRCGRSCPIRVDQRASDCICVKPCLLRRRLRRRYSAATRMPEPHAPETHPCARQFPHNASRSHPTRNETLVRRPAHRLLLPIPTRRGIVSSVVKRDGRETLPASQRGFVRTPARCKPRRRACTRTGSDRRGPQAVPWLARLTCTARTGTRCSAQRPGVGLGGNHEAMHQSSGCCWRLPGTVRERRRA
jgi:hypothetical protein